MCGITGILVGGDGAEARAIFKQLLIASEIRGQDGTGITIGQVDYDELKTQVQVDRNQLVTFRSPLKASQADLDTYLKYIGHASMAIAQNRLAIFGLGHENDQPLVNDKANVAIVHNGNLIAYEERFKYWKLPRKLQVDSELILRIIEIFGIELAEDYLNALDGDMAILALADNEQHESAIYAYRRYKPLFTVVVNRNRYFFSTERIGRKVFSAGIEFHKIEANRLHKYTI